MLYIKLSLVGYLVKTFSTAWIYFDCLDIFKDFKKCQYIL